MAGVRRTWDKEAYEAKAVKRATMGDEADEKIPATKSKSQEIKEEFVPATSDASGPMGSERAFIKARQGRIDLESKVGKTQIVASVDAVGSAAAGWWCEVCDCLLKDSVSYLDHINGKKHQRALGYSMRVERADVSKVKERLDMLKRKIVEKQTAPVKSAVDDYEERLAVIEAEEEFRKKKKKEDLIARKKEKEIAEMESVDPEIAAMMGFGGFGSSK